MEWPYSCASGFECSNAVKSSGLGRMRPRFYSWSKNRMVYLDTHFNFSELFLFIYKISALDLFCKLLLQPTLCMVIQYTHIHLHITCMCVHAHTLSHTQGYYMLAFTAWYMPWNFLFTSVLFFKTASCNSPNTLQDPIMDGCPLFIKYRTCWSVSLLPVTTEEDSTL